MSRPSSRMNAAEMPSWRRAADCEIVDRPVDRELADVAAREEERTDHERVGGDREPQVIHPGERQYGLIAELIEHRVAQDVAEERGDQRVARLPARAVAHGDGVLAQRGLALAYLRDAFEDALLGVRDSRRRRLDRRAAAGFDGGLGHLACTGSARGRARRRSRCGWPLPLPCRSPEASTRSRSRAREYRPKL